MKTCLRITLSGFSLAALLAGAFWIVAPKRVAAEAPDVQIPAYVKGKRISLGFGNGEILASVTVTTVVYLHNEPWWIVQLPATAGQVNFNSLTVNPRQIRTLAFQ